MYLCSFIQELNTKERKIVALILNSSVFKQFHSFIHCSKFDKVTLIPLQYIKFFSNQKCLTVFGVQKLKTGRREVLGSNPGRACRPKRSEISVIFSGTRVNTDSDPLERPPRRARPL